MFVLFEGAKGDYHYRLKFRDRGYLKAEKWHQYYVLNRLINSMGMAVTVDRKEGLARFLLPFTVRYRHVFIRNTNFFRDLVKGYSKLVVPLTTLLEKNLRKSELISRVLDYFTAISSKGLLALSDLFKNLVKSFQYLRLSVVP